MTVTAEAIDTNKLNLDTTLMALEYIHPPESEIYGRSLSTIRRLGAFMIGKQTAEVTLSPEASQARAEFYTSVEEGFGTDLELGGGLEVRNFAFRSVLDGRVMAKDLKTPISEMTKAGLKCAGERAKKDNHFFPQLIRSKWDHENALIVDKMASGDTTYNTRIVISPFPEEAAVQSGDKYWRNIGYVPHLKRGFVQLYHASEDGVIAGSLSFDGSDKEHLRNIFKSYGIEIPYGEVTDNWLQYAITDTLSEVDAKALAIEIANQASSLKYEKTTNTVDVTNEYSFVMDKVFNESYVHVCESLYRGIQTQGIRELIDQLVDKAEHFNSRYTKALYDMRSNKNQFTNDDSIVLHELLVYSTIEMMRALHLKVDKLCGGITKNNFDRTYFQLMNPSAFQNMLGSFGNEGARNNRIYSACGLEISPGETSEKIVNLQKAYAGNDVEDCDFISKECPVCKKKNVRTIVTKSHISGDCGCRVRR